MRPPLMAMLIGTVPQWPRVVTAVMLQLPSYLEALAGAAAQMIAEAVEIKTTQKRLPIMGDLIRDLRSTHRQDDQISARICEASRSLP